jgi:glycosyltransferase involved in cell wall biosynthesis
VRVLYVHNDYGSPGGEETAAEGLATLLSDHGHKVFWFRRSSTEIIGSPTGSLKAFWTGLWNPFAARQLSKTLDETTPDLVQVQNIYPLISPSIFRPIKDRGISVVMRCPNYRLFCPNGLHLARGKVCERCLTFGREFWCLLMNCEASLFKSMGYALRNACARVSGSIVRNVDMFIVQTEFQRQKFVEAGIPRSQIGIVPALMLWEGREESSKNGNLISFVGRVSPEKGIEDFIGAARLMPGIPFAVAGHGDKMPGIKEKAPANVRWLGFLRSKELRELYIRSRIIVVPSRWYESFPNVVVQAMAHGRPVVAADTGALPNIVQDGETGLLFKAGDPADLAVRLSTLYTNDALCRTLGETGRERALTRYSPQSVYSALMTVYAKAMPHGCPPKRISEPLAACKGLFAQSNEGARRSPASQITACQRTPR